MNETNLDLYEVEEINKKTNEDDDVADAVMEALTTKGREVVARRGIRGLQVTSF